ncbi:tryptophan--tRNA ligase [Candidatus Hepatobacter penaei]|uniref:tryptophan--tRNA ligase n=1 Tax=Candidatus Hepatobacter penaei TaxID=1274402 RepID=UPI0004F3BAAF|nr:tryptophan--tRNA ligase [Candidatus Hepatobacter penaei]TGW14889.1 tryptophan--tRNA ligase [bacterium NHP-B]
MSFRLLTGIKPTGTLHLGNYVGAMRPSFSLMQNNEGEGFLFIADGHALTSVQKGDTLRKQTLEIAAAWLAMGLDLDRVVFYRQSQLPAVFELFWILSCLCPKGLMNRAHAYKAMTQSVTSQKAQEIDQHVGMGLYNYPILMAADILLFRADRVPVGSDQKQHVEIARDLAQKMNQTYGDILRVPSPFIQEDRPPLAGLDGRKMSKSYDNIIPLFSAPDVLRKGVFKMKTDSRRPEEPKDPETCSLFALFQSFASAPAIQDMKKRYANGIGWADMKEATFQVINETLSPLREAFDHWIANPQAIEQTLAQGEARAQDEANAVMKDVRHAVGFFNSNS